MTKRNMERAYSNSFDDYISENIKSAKQVPVLINYSNGSGRFEKTPDANDLSVIDKVQKLKLPLTFPALRGCLETPA